MFIRHGHWQLCQLSSAAVVGEQTVVGYSDGYQILLCPLSLPPIMHHGVVLNGLGWGRREAQASQLSETEQNNEHGIMRESEPCGLEGIHVCMTVGRWCVCVSCGNVFITRVTPCHCVCKQPTRYHKCSFNGWADNFNPQPSPTTILLNVILSPRMGKTPGFFPLPCCVFHVLLPHLSVYVIIPRILTQVNMSKHNTLYSIWNHQHKSGVYLNAAFPMLPSQPPTC